MKDESALGVALNTISRKKKIATTIRVCDNCETPLIWTFAFPYCERFCLNCGAKGGMLGTGDDVPITKELRFKKRLVDAIWKVIYGKKGLLPTGQFGRSGCKKDNGSCGNHQDHLTSSEKEWNEIAIKYLKQVQGLFNDRICG